MLFLVNIGLDYLSLERTASTLSGGEAQRIRLATQIGSGLMGVLYVCDEPSVGLHPVDDHRLIETLKRLRDLGNTVLIVEHDEAIMRSADHVIDLGPAAGEHGGEIIATGTVEDIIETADSITGQYLSGRRRIPIPMGRRRGNRQHIMVKGARQNNLKDIDVKIPLGMLVCITGVSGSGKSTLINEVLYKSLAKHFYRAKDRPGESDGIKNVDAVDKVVNIDQSPIGRTPRSNPATYTNTFTPIRELFATMPEARVRGYKPGRSHSTSRAGRCEGVLGRRLRHHRDALPARRDRPVRGLSGQALQPRGARDQVQRQEHRRRSRYDRHRGLGVLHQHTQGQEQAPDHVRRGPGLHPARPACDDPERRRSPARQTRTELAKRATGNTLYILDEPTTGLSFEDCAHLLRVLHRLVDAGNSVVLIEHHLDLINAADHLIDLGPGAGDAGGYVIAEGTPEEVAEIDGSHTGQYLKARNAHPNR